MARKIETRRIHEPDRVTITFLQSQLLLLQEIAGRSSNIIDVQGRDVEVEIIPFPNSKSEDDSTHHNFLFSKTLERLSRLRLSAVSGKPFMVGEAESKQLFGEISDLLSDPTHDYYLYTTSTPSFSNDDYQSIAIQMDNKELSLKELAFWQRSRVVPVSYVFRVPKEEKGARGLRGGLKKLRRQVAEDHVLELSVFDKRGSIDYGINLILAVTLLRETKDCSSVEDLVLFLEEQGLILEFEALHLLFRYIFFDHMFINVGLQTVMEPGELPTLFRTLALWTTVCSQELLKSSNFKEVVSPIEYSETNLNIPLGYIPYAMAAQLRFILSIPTLCPDEELIKSKFRWADALEQTKSLVGDSKAGRVSYFDKLTVAWVTQAMFEASVAGELPKNMEKYQSPLTVGNLRNNFPYFTTAIQDQVLDVVEPVQEVKKLIDEVIKLYEVKPSCLHKPSNEWEQLRKKADGIFKKYAL